MAYNQAAYNLASYNLGSENTVIQLECEITATLNALIGANVDIVSSGLSYEVMTTEIQPTAMYWLEGEVVERAYLSESEIARDIRLAVTIEENCTAEVEESAIIYPTVTVEETGSAEIAPSLRLRPAITIAEIAIPSFPSQVTSMSIALRPCHLRRWIWRSAI